MQATGRPFRDEGEKRTFILYLCQFYHLGRRFFDVFDSCFLVEAEGYDLHQTHLCF